MTKKKKRGSGGFGGKRAPITLKPITDLQPADISSVTSEKQRTAIEELRRMYPSGTLHTSEGEFVWRAPAQQFAMVCFFVDADGLIDIRSEVVIRRT